jgi:hypothetical protein
MTLTETTFGEQAESYLEDEGYLDEGGEEDEAYDEERAARRRRPQRGQQRVVERRRRIAAANAARRRPGGPSPTRPSQPSARAAVAAVRQLDLETKVQDDLLRDRLAADERRMSRSEMAAVAAVVSGQFQAAFQDRFTELRNPYVRAALTYAPLLLLSPRKRGTGAGAIVSDPRAIGAALVVGLAFAGDRLTKRDDVVDVRLVGASEVTANQTTTFLADARDNRGVVLAGKTPSFESSDPNVATIDPRTGVVTAKQPGSVVITANVDRIVNRVVLTVRPAPALTAPETEPVAAAPETEPVAANIRLRGPEALAANSPGIFLADVFDSQGNLVPDKQVTFRTSDSNIASIKPKTGRVRARTTGPVVISAEVDGVKARTVLNVT